MMDFTNPHFEEPRWLVLAVAGPLLLALLQRHAGKVRQRQLSEVASPRFIGELTASHSPARRGFKHVLLLLSVAFVGLALARPQWGELEVTERWAGEDVVFALDCSKSMLATDIAPSRLGRSKLAVLDFVRRHGQGRVGLVAFAGSAFLQCPLTLDYEAFEQALDSVNEKTIPIPGTDIGRALEEAYRGMKKESRRKLIVLVTDGEDLEQTGLKKAESLATNGVVVFTVGVGTPAGTEIRTLNESGQMVLLRDAKGEVVRSRLDQENLAAIAKATGGGYQPLGPAGEGLAKVRQAIETLNRSTSLTRTRGIERFHFPVAAALLLMVAESLMSTRRKRIILGNRSAGAPAPASRQAAVAGAIIFLSCLVTFGATDDTTNSADSLPPPPAPKSSRELYNAGTRKLAEGKLSEAEPLLQAALATQDERIQPATLYNLGHVRFGQGETALKKGPSAQSIVQRSKVVQAAAREAMQLGQAALADNDVQKWVDAYRAGRGVRQEARAIIEAFKQAMETYGATLQKWNRSLGDFKSAIELNPSDTNAVRNAEIVQEAIAKLVDSIRKMQEAMRPMAGNASPFNDMMRQLRGRIPDDMMPPGASGGDEEEELSMDAWRGNKEGPSKEGEQMEWMPSPQEAGDLLRSLKPDEKRGLPLDTGGPGQPTDRNGRDW